MKQQHLKRIVTASLFILAIYGAGVSASSRQSVDFKRDIEPIFAGQCYQCHGPKQALGQLRLDSKKLALQGGISGAPIKAGNSGASLLVQRLLGLDGQPRMPMGGKPLSDAEIALIRTWIDQGAIWPADASSSGEPALKRHWAYVKPSRPAVPSVSRPEWMRNPIDSFVLSRLEKEGLLPSPEATREKLLRRVYLDLIGLPPSPTEIDRFLADKSPMAYEQVVDQLLASRHYGERMARHWLDLARYADSNGYEKDNPREMWKYRDWLINAFNADMPFDRFTIEQIAGDMLPDATLDQRIATGFHRNTMLNQEGGIDPEEARFETIVDRVNTTATVWLGSTLACAQCHNHKYDPFSQKDYYRFYAFFESSDYQVGYQAEGEESSRYVKEPEILLASPEQEARKAETESEISKLNEALKQKTPSLETAERAWETRLRAAPRAWVNLEPMTLKSQGGTLLSRESDQTVFASGPNPEIETYTIRSRTTSSQLTALRVEALPDPRLPQGGPGRDPYGNFLMTGIEVQLEPANRKAGAKRARNATRPARVVITDGRVDDSAYTFDAQRFLDQKPLNAAVDNPRGWYINATRDTGARLDRQAVFLFDKPIGHPAGSLITVRLKFAGGSLGQGIGRFRVSVTSEKDPFFVVSISARLRRVLNTSVQARTPKEASDLTTQFRNTTPLLKTERDRIAELRQQLTALGIVSAKVMREKDSSERPSTYLRERGGFLNKGEKVYAGVPAALYPMVDSLPQNRLGLAYWLVDENNPLTARVAVNRMWEQAFGRGLVETSEDFGSQSAPPSHSDLLDWLATEFVAQKWSMKALARLIVTSATYRQSSSVSAAAYEKDPYNRLLARGPRFRMEAEMIRDVSLAAAGTLSQKIGGKSVYPIQPEGIWRNPYSRVKWETSPGEDRHRRSIYTFIRRTSPYPSYMAFDGTSRETCTVRRVRTNTPLQALAGLNDEAAFEAARELAERIEREGGADADSRISYGMLLCVARRPNSKELTRLKSFFEIERSRFTRDPESARKAIGSGGASAKTDSERAAWIMIANVLLNLDETLTKE